MKNKLLVLEFALLCLALPSIIIVFRLAPFMFFFLWSAALFCYLALRLSRSPILKNLWRWEAVTWENLKIILPRWILASCGMVIFMSFYDPNRLFSIIRDRPQIIPFLLVGYPLLSALPQEFVFCTYFFERFKKYFPTDTAMILASALVFAYAHMLFINWVAPVLSLIAGIIFATTYARTRSLALVTIEHGLYGNVLFLIGLGWYFYGGAVELR